MKNLVIGDLHFGTKSNSQQWLQYQINYFEKQIFNIVQDNLFDRIIFLGDLTDIRWAINQQIGCELKNLIRKLSFERAKKYSLSILWKIAVLFIIILLFHMFMNKL